MTWLRVDDTALTHPRVLHLRSLRDPVATAEAVVGWVMLAASWSGQQNSDCFVPEAAGVFASPEHWEHLARLALKAGMVTRPPAAVRREHGGQRGWMVVIGEGELFHLLSREEIAARKERRNITRRIPEKIETLLRDGDQCRYCADPVNEFDRKGAKQREMDHPDPDDPSVVVVACKECNGLKAKRSVEQWVADGGRPLLPPPAERGVPLLLRPKTREWLEKQNVLLDDDPSSSPVARTGTQPDAAATRPAADQAREPSTAPNHTAAPEPAAEDLAPRPDPRTTTRGVAGQVLPGRVGSGSGLVSIPSSSGDPPRRRPRSRGSRGQGQRRRQPPPS